MQTLKVLHCVPWIAGGGVEAAKGNLIGKSDRQAWVHAVACFSAQGPWKSYLEECGARIFSLCSSGEPQRFWNPLTWLRLVQACRSFRPDVVTGSMFEGILHAHFLARVFRLPLVVEDQFDPWGKGGRLGRFSYHQAVRHSRLAISVSERGLAYLQQRVGLPPEKTRTIYNPARTIRAAVGHEIPFLLPPDDPQRPWIGTLSRLDDEHKKISLLLEAVGQLGTGVRVLIVGDGPDRARLEKHARAVCPDVQVVFAGYQSDPASLLPTMGIFVAPSAHEAMPLALAEAMAAGRCCVGSRVGGIPEMLGPRDDDSLGECGKLFSSGSKTELAQILGSLLHDAAKRRDLGGRASERARRLFHPERHARGLLDAYREVLGKKDLRPTNNKKSKSDD